MTVLLLWATASTVLNRSMPPDVLLFVLIGAIVRRVVLFGLTSLRAWIPSRLVGVLPLAFVAARAIGVGLPLLVYSGGALDWMAVARNGASALVLLAIGHGPRTGTTAVERSRPSPDSTTE